MYKLYSHRTKRLLALVQLADPITTDQIYSFTILEGYRNIRKSWKRGRYFRLETEDGTSKILIPHLPTEKSYTFQFTVL